MPTGPAGTVTLSVTDYDRLVDRASQPALRPDPPPVPAVVARAELRVRVAADMARGTLRLEGEVFHRGHVKIPLVTGATLLEARADGVVLPLVQEGDLHAAVLSGPGPFTLTLDWAAPVATAPRSRDVDAAVSPPLEASARSSICPAILPRCASNPASSRADRRPAAERVSKRRSSLDDEARCSGPSAKQPRRRRSWNRGCSPISNHS